jgi:hypothetical protein
MEAFKIDNWKRDNIDINYLSLDSSKTEMMMHSIATHFGVLFNKENLFIKMQDILEEYMVILDINEEQGFKILSDSMNIQCAPNDKICIIWDVDTIDMFNYSTLLQYWDYVWYGTGDEACIVLFPNVNHIVMITDYGTIYVGEWENKI